MNKLTLEMLERTILKSSDMVHAYLDVRILSGRYLFFYENVLVKIYRKKDNYGFGIRINLKEQDVYPFTLEELCIKENYLSDDTVFYFDKDCITFKDDKNSFMLK